VEILNHLIFMKTNQIIDILKVVSWIIFIGLCIKTGAMLFSFLISLFVTSDAGRNLYMGLNLSELLSYSIRHYVVLGSLVIVLSGLKAYLFYYVVKIISGININHPFSKDVANLISKMSAIALQIGITAFITGSYAKWLLKYTAHFTFDGGGTEYFYLAGILFVIAVIFNKGIELQTENELTI
jgi:hypothetical protein